MTEQNSFYSFLKKHKSKTEPRNQYVLLGIDGVLLESDDVVVNLEIYKDQELITHIPFLQNLKGQLSKLAENKPIVIQNLQTQLFNVHSTFDFEFSLIAPFDDDAYYILWIITDKLNNQQTEEVTGIESYDYPYLTEKIKTQNQRIIELENQLKSLQVKQAKELSNLQKQALRAHEFLQCSHIIRESFFTLDFHELIQDAMVFDRPKETIGGDFCWAAKLQNHHMLLALADCTGHGMEGNYMAMMVYLMLNQIAYQEGITSPATILQHLHENLLRISSQNDYKRFLDIAICHLDFENNTIKFSGAKQNLWIFSQEKLTELNGNTASVGGLIKNVVFEEHEVSIDKNSFFYLFSDGMPQQLGGIMRKKFNRWRLRNLLQEIHTLSSSQQTIKIEESFMQWKGTHPQLDDVLILGWKV